MSLCQSEQKRDHIHDRTEGDVIHWGFKHQRGRWGDVSYIWSQAYVEAVAQIYRPLHHQQSDLISSIWVDTPSFHAHTSSLSCEQAQAIRRWPSLLPSSSQPSVSTTSRCVPWWHRRVWGGMHTEQEEETCGTIREDCHRVFDQVERISWPWEHVGTSASFGSCKRGHSRIWARATGESSKDEDRSSLDWSYIFIFIINIHQHNTYKAHHTQLQAESNHIYIYIYMTHPILHMYMHIWSCIINRAAIEHTPQHIIIYI